MTTSQRAQNESNFAHYDSQADSRTMVGMGDQRSAKVLYDLLAKHNFRNSKAADRYDRGEVAADGDGVEQSILSRLERVFASANLNLLFRVRLRAHATRQMSDSGFITPVETFRCDAWPWRVRGCRS
jgi:hypothetical protein